MAKIAARGPSSADDARAVSPPGRTPLILLAGNAGNRLDDVAKALERRGPSVRVVTLVEAQLMVSSVRPDLLVILGQDADTAKLEHLIRAAGQVPSALLAATREQRQALRWAPSGSVLVVPPLDSEETGIRRVARLANNLARSGEGLDPSDLPARLPPAPSTRPSSRPGSSATPPPMPARSRPPPAAETRGRAEGSGAPILPRPPKLPTLPRIVTSAPPPAGRVTTSRSPRSLASPAPVRTHSTPSPATSNPPPPPAQTVTPTRSSTRPPTPVRSSPPPPPAPSSRPVAAEETPLVEEPRIPKFRDVPQALSSIPPALVSAATVSHAPPRRRRSAGPWIAGLTGLVLVGAAAAGVPWMGWPRVSSTVRGWVATKVHSSAPAVPSQGVAAPAAPVPSAGLPMAASGVAASSAASAAPAPPPVEGIVEAQVDTPSCERLLEGFPAEAKPPSAYAQIKRATELLRVRKLDDAQRLYCRAIADQPGQAAPRLALLELLLQRHDNQAVVVHGRQARQAFPQESQFAWLLGDGLAKGGKWADARAVWLGPSAGQPEEAQRVSALARQNLNTARAAAKPGYFAQAERAFRRVAILDPTDVEASTGLVQMLLKSDDPKAAAAWARHGLRRAPKYASLHVMLGNGLAAAGDREGARAAWQEALKLDGGNREALARLRRAR